MKQRGSKNDPLSIYDLSFQNFKILSFLILTFNLIKRFLLFSFWKYKYKIKFEYNMNILYAEFINVNFFYKNLNILYNIYYNQFIHFYYTRYPCEYINF